MCRIAGIVNKSLTEAERQHMVKDMCTVLKHGGPDDEGIYTNETEHTSIGHRRLSIIDVSSGGHQPMSYPQGRYIISYNGELYNYAEIKNQLQQAGFQFTTQSDTEVVIAAFAAWGTAAFQQFNGMFALAILDTKTSMVTLARDPSGIKPLYYAITNEGLAFASEVRAFKKIPYLLEENKHWQVYFMAYGHLPETVTTLQQVKPLEKGCYLTYNISTAAVKITNFFRYSYIEKINDRSVAIELVKEQLEKAVQRHLISDAPIGVFLSGGLDSSIITLLADKHQQQLNAVSIYLESKEFSEKKYQDVLIKQLSCNHHQFLLKEEDFHTHLPSIIQAMDLPCCDGINSWFISKYAKESGLKAVLSGIGGDELYGGYPSFNRIGKALLLQQLPNKVLWAGRFSNSRLLNRLAYLSIEGAIGRYLFLRGQFIPVEIARHLNMDEAEVWSILQSQPIVPNIDYLTPPNQASWLETNLYMQNQLLRDTDIMSMAHGIEMRVPFLDKEFVQLSLQISSTVKYRGKLGKQLLIDAYKDNLPEIIWNRPKMGFAFPFKEWFSNPKYSRSQTGKDFSDIHTRLKNSQLHWSQFFTLLMLEEYPHAH